MKVALACHNSTYWFVSDTQSGEYLDTDQHFDIPDDIWEGYQRFCKEARAWQAYMYKLDTVGQRMSKEYENAKASAERVRTTNVARRGNGDIRS
jgi:hypothetical protein